MSEEPTEKEQSSNMKIVGINLAVLAAYTIICGIYRAEGFILDAFLLAIHFIVCLIVAAAVSRSIWLLSGLAVLLIGISTCVGVLSQLH